jgi:hypothetical protein
MKLEGSSCLQFPFGLTSPSFSDGPGLQDNIFDSLSYQVVQILYEPPHENRKKNDDHCPDFIFAHASLEIVVCAIPYSASWFQGRVQKTNIPHLL